MTVHNPENQLPEKGSICAEPTSSLIHEGRAATDGQEEAWFSERFTAMPDYGWLDIMSPSVLLGLFARADARALPDLNFGQSTNKAGLQRIAELTLKSFSGIFPKSWSSLEDCNLPSVGEAIAGALANIAMAGVLAEATWQTQLAQVSGQYKPNTTYAAQIQRVLSEMIAVNTDAGPFNEGLLAALDVGAAVIAEFAANAQARSEISRPKNGGAGGSDSASGSIGPMPVPYQI